MPEEVSVTFDPEIDLGDDAVGRSRYERFYSVRSNYEWENLTESSKAKSIKHISKNSPKSSKIPDYTGRAHVLRDVK